MKSKNIKSQASSQAEQSLQLNYPEQEQSHAIAPTVKTNNFSNFSEESQFNSLKQRLRQQRIQIKLQENIVSEPQISVFRTDSQSVVYRLSVGWYESQISTLRINLPHNFSQNKNFVFSGGYSKIFIASFEKREYAVKFVEIKTFNEKQIKNVLREIFILKIGSALEVSPRFYSLYGYDCVVFSDGIEFIMENCQNKFEESQIKHQIAHRNLQQSLRILHLLHICHCDIKPDNIAWSHKKNKMVFLDFGFSQFVMENRDQETKTTFRGSFDYCCPAMRKTYTLESAAPVNLYENDRYGLQKIINKLSQNLANMGRKEFDLSIAFQRINNVQEQADFYQKNINDQYQAVKNQGFNFNQSFTLCSYDTIWFFRLKYCLFFQLEIELQNVLYQNTNGQFTMIFGRLLLEEWENIEVSKTYWKKKLFSLYEKYLKGKQGKHDSPEAKKIYQYVEQKHNRYNSAYIDTTIWLFAQEPTQSKLDKYWGDWEWMNRMFNFLLPLNINNIPNEKYRLKIVSDLYCSFRPSNCLIPKGQRNPYKEYHFVLQKFLHYFISLIDKKQMYFQTINFNIIILKASFIIMGDYKKNQEIQQYMIAYIKNPIRKMQKIFEFFLQKFLLYRTELGCLQFGVNYKQQIMKLEGKNEQQCQQIRHFKQNYLQKINHLERIIQQTFQNCDQSYLKRENRKLYDSIANNIQQHPKSKILQEICQCLKNISPSLESVNFWVSSVKGKINDYFEGTSLKEEIFVKAPLYHALWFMNYRLGIQVPQQYLKREIQLEMSLEKPQFFSLTQGKTLKWAYYISSKQLYMFLLSYFQYFTQKKLKQIQDPLKIRCLRETVLGTIEAILMSSIKNDFSQKQKELKRTLIQNIKAIAQKLICKNSQFQLLFQGSIFRLNGEINKAFKKFQQGFWNSKNVNQKSFFIYNIIELRSDLTFGQMHKFSEIILSYKSQHPLISPCVMVEFLKQSTATVEAFCYKGDIFSAFQFMKKDSAKLKALGKSYIEENMFKQLQHFSYQLSVQQIVQILKRKLFQQTLHQLHLNNFFDFYFGLFHAVFQKVENFLSIKDKKRFLIIAIFGNSRFYHNHNNEEAYLRKKIFRYFPIKSQRKKEIYTKKLFMLGKNLNQLEKSLLNKKHIKGTIFLKIKLKIQVIKGYLVN